MVTKEKLDDWQKEILETKGNICLRSGRQVGKSEVISIKAGDYAVQNPKRSIMVIASTERQAYLLFSKILYYLHDNFKNYLKSGKDRPTKSEIKLKNGSIIRCLPTGKDGLGIRGFTVDLLIADECAFIPNDVFPAVMPAVLTTGGQIIVLSTPFGKSGYFYDCFNDPNFKKFHITTPEVAEKREEPQRSNMLDFIARQRERMTNVQFAQEILGEFVDELRQVFSDDLLRKVCVLKREKILPKADYFGGGDIASMGDDASTFIVVDRTNKERLRQVENIVTTKTMINETVRLWIELKKRYNLKKIYIDDGGIGVAVFQELLRNDETKRCVIGLNNSRRSIDNSDKQFKKTVKDDLYANLLYLMQSNKVQLLDDDDIYHSLKSCQYEINKEKNTVKIVSTDNHIAEGIVRACWCYQDKSLSIWAR